jgi:thymidylate synthase (FAD)
MEVSYLDHMGSDLTVVNAARVSFGKRKERFDDKDARLIAYLVKHKHVLPFRHPQVSFHFKAPIFVARQLVKHQVGMSWSEISRRYVSERPEVYIPDMLRKAADNVKQGSAEEPVEDQAGQMFFYQAAVERAVLSYEALLAAGVAPEQARMVLPVAHYTEWHWTGSLLAWAQVWNLRVEHSAQKETQDCVRQIGPTMERLFPVSWKELTHNV